MEIVCFEKWFIFNQNTENEMKWIIAFDMQKCTVFISL